MDTKKIKDTLFLPKTDFPLKNINHQITETKIRQKWKNQQIYQKVLEKNKHNSSFVLHDGPTFANSKIHVGHVLNQTLKDIIIRFYASQGYYTPFLLGWDCHGLPIEHKVLQIHQNQEIDLRKKCNEYASQQVEIQKKQLEQLGIFTDYNKYYITSDKYYEAEQVRIFAELVRKNLVYRGWKPIYWSCSHATALAEAEVEYLEKKDTSLYFKIYSTEISRFFNKENVSLLVWTTQPWTIPANELVAVKKNANYVLVECGREHFIILKKMSDILESWGYSVKIEKIFLGEEILGFHYTHPYRKNDELSYIVDGDEFIRENEGTGIVHLAPAFGAEDFNLAKKEKIISEISCPLEPNGCFNEKIKISEFIDKHYTEVNNLVITDLEKKNLIMKKKEIIHSYPHDWRDKSPLIYRLTEQWFINIQAIKPDLLKNIEKVKWHPHWAKEKMKQAIKNREDWCISRQRKWGVPVPVLYKQGRSILNVEIIDYIADLIVKHGSDCWFDNTILSFLREKFPHLDMAKLGKDTMDVWLDSGVSHWCILQKW